MFSFNENKKQKLQNNISWDCEEEHYSKLIANVLTCHQQLHLQAKAINVWLTSSEIFMTVSPEK